MERQFWHSKTDGQIILIPLHEGRNALEQGMEELDMHDN